MAEAVYVYDNRRGSYSGSTALFLDGVRFGDWDRARCGRYGWIEIDGRTRRGTVELVDTSTGLVDRGRS